MKTPPERGDRIVEELLLELVERLPRLYFKLKAFGDRIWSPLGITTAERGILTDLAAGEPLTMPQLAAMRPVSRQAIHPVLTSLLERGLVSTRPNPRNARSPFHVATRQGRKLLAEGRRRERRVLASLEVGIPASEVRQSLRFLGEVESVLASALEKEA